MERRVNRGIGEMPLVWLRVYRPAGTAIRREHVERNAIALLSNYHRAVLDPPSVGWLGRDYPKERVRRSGLWNQRHADEAYNPAFLPALEALVGVHVAAGGRP